MGMRSRKVKLEKQSQSSDKRLDKNYNAGKDRDDMKYNAVHPTIRKKKRKNKMSLTQLLVFMVGYITMVGGTLFYYYSKYGVFVLFGRSFYDYKLSPYDWRKFIDDNEKTILLIGGPHRSGTTIVWQAIKQHPDVSGFGNRFETGVDYSEGVLFQEVYPRFGVGVEFKKNFGLPGRAKGDEDEKQDGLGRFALLPEDEVHWTNENKRGKLEDANNLSKILNRFAPFWDKIKKYNGNDGLKKAKVWVEKSPQNGVLTTFLEGLYNMPILEDGSVDIESSSEKTCTKFIYMTRHPIANIYATDIFVQKSMGGFIDFEILLRNYIKMHEYMKMDEKKLNSPAMWIRLEDFTTNPIQELKKIYSFLGVADDDKTVIDVLNAVHDIEREPNIKYISKWCLEGISEHGHLLKKYEDDLKSLDLGYDLDVCE